MKFFIQFFQPDTFFYKNPKIEVFFAKKNVDHSKEAKKVATAKNETQIWIPNFLLPHTINQNFQKNTTAAFFFVSGEAE